MSFVDTTLYSPLAVTNPVTKLRQYEFVWGSDYFLVKFNLLDASDNVVEQRELRITGTDFDTYNDAVIAQNKVGETYKSVIAAALQQLAKTEWGLTGTE